MAVFADPGYQPDKMKRYDISDKDKTKAALSYIGMPKNRKKYKPADLVKVEARIRSAAKKFGIEVSEKGGSTEAGSRVEAPAGTEAAAAVMLPSQVADSEAAKAIAQVVKDAVAKAQPKPEEFATIVKSAIESHVLPVVNELRQEVATAKAGVEKAQADNAALRTDLNAANEALSKANASLVAVVGEAAKPSVPGGLGTTQTDGVTKGHAALGTEEKTPRASLDSPLTGLAAAVYAQRLAAQAET